MCFIINHSSCIINDVIYDLRVQYKQHLSYILNGLYRTMCCEVCVVILSGGGGGHVISALDLGGIHELCMGLAPVFWPPPTLFK